MGPIFTPEQIAFLRTDDGLELLAEAASMPTDSTRRVMALRKRYPADRTAAAVELLELRQRAVRKFTQADQMFFTREGLEQSSGSATAKWRAAYFPTGALVLDLCCGIGGDSMALAERGPTISIDDAPTLAACARANRSLVEACQPGCSAAVACADLTRLRLRGECAVFDPSRRAAGRRVRSMEEYSPPLSFIETLSAVVPNIAVKLSPAIPSDQMEALPGRWEFISDRGECKEAVLWRGSVGPQSARSAVVLPNQAVVEFREAAPPPVSRPKSFILEPDPAVIRAGLVELAAELAGAAVMDHQIAYLTSDRFDPSPFWTGYTVIDAFPFSLRQIQETVRQLGARLDAVKRRGVPIQPEDILPRVKSSGERPIVAIITRVDGEMTAILAERA